MNENDWGYFIDIDDADTYLYKCSNSNSRSSCSNRSYNNNNNNNNKKMKMPSNKSYVSIPILEEIDNDDYKNDEYDPIYCASIYENNDKNDDKNDDKNKNNDKNKAKYKNSNVESERPITNMLLSKKYNVSGILFIFATISTTCIVYSFIL